MDFSLMETDDLEILLKITEIDIKLAELFSGSHLNQS